MSDSQADLLKRAENFIVAKRRYPRVQTFTEDPVYLVEELAAQLAATHAAIRALRDEFAHSALVAGQYSVECRPSLQVTQEAVAATFTDCAEKLSRLLGDPEGPRP